MQKKDFNETLENVLSQYDFHYINNAYYFDNDETIIVIATQKSSYDNSYYINFGFLIKKVNPKIKYPKDNNCDVFGRFVFDFNRKQYYSVNLDDINVEELSASVRNFIEVNIKPVINDGLYKYFEINPKAVLTATLKARGYLGLAE